MNRITILLSLIFNLGISQSSSWVQQKILTSSDAAAEDYFGGRVSIDGDYAVVGAYGNDDVGSKSGSAYIFIRSEYLTLHFKNIIS